MNTCCPGFVPHHVKPNRCRRCFKDIHDHQSTNEVTTSFTLPLPRRRRESVAVTETPKAIESSTTDQSASFTITETTATGQRTRQRSSSTSSWFQEKKINEDSKEKIDALFRNADDSKASYRNIGMSDETDDKSVDTVAVIRLPESRSRRKYTQDSSNRSSSTERSRLDSKPAHTSSDQGSSKIDSRSPSAKFSDLKSRSASSKSDDCKPPELPPKTLDN